MNTTHAAEIAATLAALLAEQHRDNIDEPVQPIQAISPRVLLKVEEAAERLGIGRTSMYRLVSTGEIESVRIGRLRRIPESAVAKYAERLAAKQNAA